MTQEEKQQTLEKTATDLFDYVDEVKIIKDIFEAIPQSRGIASPYLNLRDALFHYKKMYEAAQDNDITGIIKQNACIAEHLNRGLKDFALHICSNFFIKIIHQIIDSNAGSVNTARPYLT